MVRLVEPRVIKLAETRIHDAGVKDLLNELGGNALSWLTQRDKTWPSDSEMLIEVAGRTCYESFGTGINPNITKVRNDPKEYFRNILNKGDGSILEHATVTFALVGISRVATHELVRHRVGTAYCLSGDSLIYSERKVKGRREGPRKRSLSSLFDRAKTPQGRSRIKLLRLRSLNESTREFETSRVQRIVYSGRKPLYELKLEGGYKCKMSLDHTIYTEQGWLRLRDIVEGLKQTDRTLFSTAPVKIAVNGSIVPASALMLTDGTPAYRSKGWLENQIRSGRTFNEIGSLAGTSSSTIHNWTRKLGLSRLSKSLTVNTRAGNKRLSLPSHSRSAEERSAGARQMRGLGAHPWKDGHIIPQVPDEAEYSAYHCQRIGSQIKPAKSPIKHRTVLRPKFARIENLQYVGEEDTYDIVLSGPHHNFLANGIVVHNSQESLRYVRIEEIKIPDMEASVDVHSMAGTGIEEKMLDALKTLESDYKAIVDKIDWEKLSFDEKKSITSAIRRILPQGLSTAIIFTANHRTLRWLIEMRTAPGAEYEIRSIFGQIAQICIRDYPLIYDDFEKTQLPDGTFQYKPTLRSKV